MNQSQLLDGQRTLKLVGHFIKDRCLTEASWSQLVKTFEDDASYIDFNGEIVGTRCRVTIDFGVKSDGSRANIGIFDGFWDVATQEICRVEALVLLGKQVSEAAFYDSFMKYTDLDEVLIDVAE